MNLLTIIFIALCIVVAPYVISGFLFGLEIMLGVLDELTHKGSEKEEDK